MMKGEVILGLVMFAAIPVGIIGAFILGSIAPEYGHVVFQGKHYDHRQSNLLVRYDDIGATVFITGDENYLGVSMRDRDYRPLAYFYSIGRFESDRSVLIRNQEDFHRLIKGMTKAHPEFIEVLAGHRFTMVNSGKRYMIEYDGKVKLREESSFSPRLVMV